MRGIRTSGRIPDDLYALILADDNINNEEQTEVDNDVEHPCNKKPRLNDSSSGGSSGDGSNSILTKSTESSRAGDEINKVNSPDNYRDEIDDEIPDEEPYTYDDYMNDYYSDLEIEWEKRGHKLARNQEVYHIQVKGDCCNDSICLNLLKEIGCESNFIRRSRRLPMWFFAKLTKRQAAKLKGVSGIGNMFPSSEYLYVEENEEWGIP